MKMPKNPKNVGIGTNLVCDARERSTESRRRDLSEVDGHDTPSTLDTKLDPAARGTSTI